MISSQPTRIYSQPTQQMEKVFQDQQYPQYYKMPPNVPITASHRIHKNYAPGVTVQQPISQMQQSEHIQQVANDQTPGYLLQTPIPEANPQHFNYQNQWSRNQNEAAQSPLYSKTGALEQPNHISQNHYLPPNPSQ